jgi:hypothetical protein
MTRLFPRFRAVVVPRLRIGDGLVAGGLIVRQTSSLPFERREYLGTVTELSWTVNQGYGITVMGWTAPRTA